VSAAAPLNSAKMTPSETVGGPGRVAESFVPREEPAGSPTKQEAKAAEVFRRFGLDATGFWRSVAVPQQGDATRSGIRLKEAFEELGGLYVAFGQFLNWRADLLAPEYLKALRQIRNTVPPLPRQDVATLLRRELGSGCEALAEQISEKPVWSTMARTAYRSWYKGAIVVIQVARDPVPEAELAEFEAGIRLLGHPHVSGVTAPGILAEFRQWLRQAESCVTERSYLEFLGRNRGQTLVDYPLLIPELTTDHVLCWPWVQGRPVSSLVRRGSIEAVTQVAVAVLEQYCSLSIVDAELDWDSIVMPFNGQRAAVRRLNRPLSVPPASVTSGMKYVAAVLEGNAALTVQMLLNLALGKSTGALESALLGLMSAIEPELKVGLWFPASAGAFESNWRALARLEVKRPLHLSCLHRNLIATGYWTAEAVSAGGTETDTIAEAHWPVVARLLKLNSSQFMDPATISQWSVGLGLLSFGAVREANRLAQEVRENNLSVAVEMGEPQQAPGRPRGRSRIIILIGCLLITLFAALRAEHGLAQPVQFLTRAVAVAALVALYRVVAKIS
jgi:hypothetical protein